MPDASPRSNSLAAFRALFPGAVASPYLNVASRGIVSTESHDAAVRIVDEQMSGEGSKEGWAPVMLGCREGFAQLIGAKPAEIAITKNVSEGINIVANAVDWRPGDNAVVCPELEHPNNVFIWLALQRRGVEVRKVPAANLDIDVAAMARAIDGRTRIVTASSVTFTPGYRSDIAALGAECRKRDVFFLVDAVQSAGVLGLDVAAEAIDGLAVSSSKGLLGVIGLGFLYVREAWIPRLTPAYVARFSVDLGGAHESEGAWVDEIRFMPDARRFEIGNYNWAAMAAMEASLKRLNAVGVDVIESQAVRLAEKLRDGLAARGYPVSRGPKGRRPSHIVTSGRLGTGGAYSTADERLNRFAENLKRAEVSFSIRRGQVRFGVHGYNDDADIEKVLEVARG